MEPTKKAFSISIEASPEGLARFGFVLQKGFGVSIAPGSSLKSLLCDQFGIESNYIDGRIKTAFLNGRPVDDFETAIVKDNATLALSAAMPGLVGATFRSGGILSPFRSGISYQNTEDGDPQNTRGQITLKLFNLLVKEMGPGILEKGIWLDSDVLKDVLDTENAATVFKQIMINDEVADPARLEKKMDIISDQNQSQNILVKVSVDTPDIETRSYGNDRQL